MNENSWPEIALRGQRKFALRRGREIAELRARIEILEGEVRLLQILRRNEKPARILDRDRYNMTDFMA
jgi:hypothetical protein